MTDSEKKGFFRKLFGAQKSCCCNVRIEEVPEEQSQKAGQRRPSPCCGGPAAGSKDSVPAESARPDAKKEG